MEGAVSAWERGAEHVVFLREACGGAPNLLGDGAGLAEPERFLHGLLGCRS